MSQIDPTDIRSQERANAELDERQRLAAKTWEVDLKWLMSDKRGRRIAARLLDRSGLDRPSFDTNTASMAMKEGFRWFGLWLKGELEIHCFDRFIEMLKEQRQ